ncbi:MAG: hypothetical protein FWD82_10780 [Defluviitaleaceae bacterium]|nr:hypothetical protein [Defluviitaleaceae bacterium]
MKKDKQKKHDPYTQMGTHPYKGIEHRSYPDPGIIMGLNDVVSSTECTGLVQTAEMGSTEGLNEIYDIPTQAKIKHLKEERGKLGRD